LKSPQESNTNSSRNGKSSASTADLKRLKEENGQIGQSLQSCRLQIEGLVAGRPGPKNPDAAELEEKLSDLEAMLKGHFECEEGAVLAAFRERGRPELVLSLEAVIREKEQIFARLAGLKKEAGHLIAFNLGLEPNYDSSWLLRKMEELARRIKAHKEKEESLFEEAEKATEGDSPAP
jgi:hypothetical protein